MWDKEAQKKYDARPERKAARKAYSKTEAGKRYHRKWMQKYYHSKQKWDDKYKAYRRMWKKTPAGRASSKIHSHKRRITITTIASDIKTKWLVELLHNSERCALCGKKLSGNFPELQSPTIDHIIPLCVGGTHTMDNIRILCLSCNSRRPKDGSDL